jgi:hypothetical protein
VRWDERGPASIRKVRPRHSRRPRNDQWLPQLAGGGETGAGEGGSNEDAEPALDLTPHDGGRLINIRMQPGGQDWEMLSGRFRFSGPDLCWPLGRVLRVNV